MSIFNRHTALPIACIAFIATSTGCTTRSQVFEGYSNDQLWTAMVATAKAPQYEDWKIVENDVAANDSTRRIEVYRLIKRTVVTPYAPARPEEAEWRFEIVLALDEDLQQPMVDFTARQVTVPAHVWKEADAYFAQMRTRLTPPAAAAVTKTP